MFYTLLLALNIPKPPVPPAPKQPGIQPNIQQQNKLEITQAKQSEVNKKEEKIELQKIEERPLFTVEQPTVPSLPDARNEPGFSSRYPLIPPYAFAVIKWDDANKELVYEIEEPQLTDEEKKTLGLLEEGIKELINLSFISVNDRDTVLLYLEKNIRVLLTELSIELTKESFLKIMYYIYRDFVGLNELEPLMNDYFIEDIECNGVNTPVYLVHRKYRNIKTSLIYTDVKNMMSFVEKLAQKSGKYISYAEPLLDAALPDGTRVQAVFSKDVATRGPSYTLRKFTKTPWSPLSLIGKGTVSPEIYAYLWMCVEYENSLMIIGGTGTGKCVSGDTPIYLANGGKISIKELVEKKFSENQIIKKDGWEYVEKGIEVLSMNPETFLIEKTKTDKLWRHKSDSKLVYIKTRSGREIKVTPEHPFFSVDNGELIKIMARNINVGEIIATPRAINIKNHETKYINYLDYIKNRDDLYYALNRDIKKAFYILKKKYKINESTLARKFGVKYETFRFWKHTNAVPLNTAYKILSEANIIINTKYIRGRINRNDRVVLPKLCPALFRFIGYILSDGHLTKNHIMFFNNDKTLRKKFLSLGHRLFGIKGKEEFPNNRTPKIKFNSIYMSAILHETFKIPYGNKARIIKTPEQLYSMGNICIANFLSALFDCESYVGKYDIEFSTTSKYLAPELCSLLLRLSITPRLITRKSHFRVYISGYHNILQFKNHVGYIHKDKREKIHVVLSRPISRLISNVDLIPNVSKIIGATRSSISITQNKIAEEIGVSRRLFGMWESGLREPSIITFKKFNSFVLEQDIDCELKHAINNLAESDIFWDEIAEVKSIKNDERYVYDLTVPKTHNFIAGDYPIIVHNTSFVNTVAFFIPPQARVVSIEDTKELSLEHENWLPSVARSGVGLTNLVGQKYGEVSLFDLLKASFRQRPDYIIVGEIRGAEAFVLFQAFASIRGNEEIFVLKDNKPLRIKIEDLGKEDIKKIKTISYNIKEKKYEILPVKAWIKHPKRKVLYKITTKSGREITITGDHSVFTYENNIVKSVRGEELLIGSKIIIPSCIPCGYNNISAINLLEYLPDLRVYAPNYVMQASHKLGYYQANNAAGISTITDYYSIGIASKPNAMRADKFMQLMETAKVDYKLKDLQVKFDGLSQKWPVFLEVSDEFLKLLGYYISEGSLNTSSRNYRMAFYNSNDEVLKDMEYCIVKITGKKSKMRVTDRGWGSAVELSFNHKILYEFIKRYCRTKYQKRVPDFIYGLDKRKIGVFLSALYTGDGHLRDKGINYSTTSKDLANDVAQLLQTFGIVATIRKRNRIGRKTTDYEIDFYANYKKNEFLKYVKPIGKSCNIKNGIEDKNLLGDLYIDKIKSIETINLDKSEYVYDISVPRNQNFIGGFGSILLHNSGHPGMATMHAESADTMVKRLETNPINLSGSLIETLASVVVMTQSKIKGKEVRKVSSVDEILQVKEKNEGGTAKINTVFKWDPKTDKFFFNPNSKVFENIAVHYGFTKEQVLREFKLRTYLIKALFKRGIFDFKQVQRIIHEYYKAPQDVLKRYGVI